MDKLTKTVIIVGGGNAGWITAGRLAAKHNSNSEQGLKVILVESANVPAIGVGEGTWPTMRSTLKALNISETDFIRECDASFKQGAKFAKWHDGSEDDYYYHPLVLPQGFGKTDLAGHWLAQQALAKNHSPEQSPLPANSQAHSHSFSNQVCFQEAICEQGLAPKTIRHAEFADVANYAYHLDSAKFTRFLQKHCQEKLGVTHIIDDVIGVNSIGVSSISDTHSAGARTGDIASVTTKAHGDITGDLFVDCTGFSSLLLGKHYQVPFKKCDDVLFIDTALAVQVPYENDDDAIASHTISTGQPAGWIWDIGLQSRRGVGYVYSSKHSTEAEAKQVLAEYVGVKNGAQLDSLKVRKIPINSGYRETAWQNNCVAIGLSAGFLEPLEASALVMIELGAQMISEQLPQSRAVMDIVAKRFNETALYRWQKIVDFLKLHYILSERTEPFWADNRDPSSIPESLQELMTLWQYRAPADHDFTSNNEVFPAASYQYVLYGMGFNSDYSHNPFALDDTDMANSQFEQNKKLTAKALSLLPNNRELLSKIKEFGLSRI